MIWLVGAGPMAAAYAKILGCLKIEFTVIGRGRASADVFTLETGVEVTLGGLSSYLSSNPPAATKAIVCVNVEHLFANTISLLNYGIKDILVEKPGGIDMQNIQDLSSFAISNNANVRVGYNRRHFASVLKVKELIQRDGGLQSFNFEFTEWTHRIDDLAKDSQVLNNWFLANSSHLVDLAFHLGGKPSEMKSYVSDDFFWNKSPSLFCGAGKTEGGVMFSYHANWQSAGRWSLELLTGEGKYILCPLEELFFQRRGSLALEKISFDTRLDDKFKPGLYAQLGAFISDSDDTLLSLQDHVSMLSYYATIAGYD